LPTIGSKAADVQLANHSIASRTSKVVVAIIAARGLGHFAQPPADLRKVGLSSLDFVNLMLAIEAEFGVEFRQSDMTLANFQSLKAIERLVGSVLTA
jgi:acyl carrier protein